MPSCLVGSTTVMTKHPGMKYHKGPGEGCGWPCVIHVAAFYGIGTLFPAMFAAYVLYDEKAKCCAHDKGYCNIFCQFQWCPPCAACKFYQHASNHSHNVGDIGDLDETRINPPEMEPMGTRKSF